MQEYFTVTEVAEMKNVNPETVRRWLRNGKIKGERLGGTKSGWRIHRSELYPEETHMEQRIVELIKNMLEDRAMFNQFARDVLYLLKKTNQAVNARGNVGDVSGTHQCQRRRPHRRTMAKSRP